MNRIIKTTDNQLPNALHALGVNFIMGGKDANEVLHQEPAHLLAALVQSSEARLRLSVIPLLLEHPEFAAYVCAVAGNLNPSARLTFQCYYSAAVWLQQKHQLRLNELIGEKIFLPDYFSHELGAQITDDPDENLAALAQRHQRLSGMHINWLGTYQHAAQVWLKGLDLQRGHWLIFKNCEIV